MKPIVLKLARDDLQEIRERLSEFGVNPTKRFRDSFEKLCVQAENMPYTYSRYGPSPEYRRAVHEYDYLVFYQVEEGSGRVKIYRVLHRKRDVELLIKLE